jgi:hypothetical protein
MYTNVYFIYVCTYYVFVYILSDHIDPACVPADTGNSYGGNFQTVLANLMPNIDRFLLFPIPSITFNFQNSGFILRYPTDLHRHVGAVSIFL